jgi:ParB family chromosome partitioning protein
MRSIENMGVLQPISVRRCEEGFEVVFGTHRVEACRRLGIKRIPAVISEFSEDEAFLAGITENLLRNTSINPIEEAKGYRALLRKGWTINEIARRVGKADSYVSERLSLLDRLDSSLQSILANGDRGLTPSHAELLSRISNGVQQKEIAGLVQSGKLSVRALEDLLRQVPRPTRIKIEDVSGSFCIRIPDVFVKALGLRVGQYLRMHVRGSKLTLETLTARKSKRNSLRLLGCAAAASISSD